MDDTRDKLEAFLMEWLEWVHSGRVAEDYPDLVGLFAAIKADKAFAESGCVFLDVQGDRFRIKRMGSIVELTSPWRLEKANDETEVKDLIEDSWIEYEIEARSAEEVLVVRI